MRLTEAQRYRLERAKDQTPATNHFLLWIPLFLILAWIGREELPPLASVEVHQFAVKETPRYRNNDPVCGGDAWCFLGWRL